MRLVPQFAAQAPARMALALAACLLAAVAAPAAARNLRAAAPVAAPAPAPGPEAGQVDGVLSQIQDFVGAPTPDIVAMVEQFTGPLPGAWRTARPLAARWPRAACARSLRARAQLPVARPPAAHLLHLLGCLRLACMAGSLVHRQLDACGGLWVPSKAVVDGQADVPAPPALPRPRS